jgi:tartrate dehydrogenase/decarboxylase/D-malate dehydrogenase
LGRRYRIACVPGDGIGPEIIPEGRKALEAVAAAEGITLEFETFPWGAGHYKETGEFMPPDGLDLLHGFDAVYFGAVGLPEVDDRLPFAKYTGAVRRGLEQYVNFRPVRLLRGIPSPLRLAEERPFDFVIIRENTEGEFVGVGNVLRADRPDGMALQTSVFTRKGVERVARYSFQLAAKRRGKVTNVTKSNTLTHSLKFWDDIVEEVAAEYPSVECEKMYVDAASANFVLQPERFDVIVTTNMIGDILSDLGAALMGSLGLAPSGNINPEREHPSMFEPIHGSAPDIAGRGIANPIGTIWAGALMLEHLGEDAARVTAAIEEVLADGPRTPDVGGNATTQEVGDGIVQALTQGAG